MSRAGKALFLVIAGVIAFSCKQDVLYNQYQIIEDTVWEKEKEYYFSFVVDDIDVPYNLTVEIRNNNLYPFQNLWLFCGEKSPVGPLRRDTIECVLADEYGKWYGHGISLFHLSIPLRENYYFSYKGDYTFGFRQGMRSDNLKGIQELGLKVERALTSRGATSPASGR